MSDVLGDSTDTERFCRSVVTDTACDHKNTGHKLFTIL